MGRGAGGGAESAALIYGRLIVETGGVSEESAALIYGRLVVETGEERPGEDTVEVNRNKTAVEMIDCKQEAFMNLVKVV